MNSFHLRQLRSFLLPLMLFEILLVCLTFPLWVGTSQFPAIPFVSALVKLPAAVDGLVTVLLLLSCGGCFFAANSLGGIAPESNSQTLRRTRRWLIATLAFGMTLVLLNQHRLQPWHWLFLLLSVQCSLLRVDCQLLTRRLTIASIYVFAALSRLGSGIDEGMSREVLVTLLDMVGLSAVTRSEGMLSMGCIAMTLMELLTGVLLLVPRLRKPGVMLALTTHASLLVALSPMGLNHNYAVLAWNLFFVVVVPLVFWEPGERTTAYDSVSETVVSTNRVASCMNILVVMFPIAGLFGFADNWPSWQLYSPRPDVVRLFIVEARAKSLPESLQKHIGQPSPLQIWCPVRLDRWSLQQTRSPIYPEDRFQLGIVAAILPTDIVDGEFRIEIESARWPKWWQRQRFEIVSHDELNRWRASMLLNTQSRTSVR